MEMIWSYLNENKLLIDILWSVLALLITVLLIRVVNRFLYSKIEDHTRFYMARKRVYYICSTVFLVFLAFYWSDSLTNLMTYFGLVSAGFAIALKDVFANIWAWLFIILRKPFAVGDRICINNHKGDVLDIRMFQFSLMEVSAIDNGEQSTGRIVTVPNCYIFQYALLNYDKGFKYIWNEIEVLITFESNWQKAKGLLTDIINSHSLHLSDDAARMIKDANKSLMIHYNILTPIVYTCVQDSGIQLTIRYLCVVRQRRNSINDIWEDILYAFNLEDDIELAYPTVRMV